jgi:predicted nuclease of predicted toxin-antitoxin system
MIIWIDAQLPPGIAGWLTENFAVDATPLRDLGLRDAEDEVIFQAARSAAAVLMTKDSDLVSLLNRHGPPPALIWLTCGNTSNARLRQILSAALPDALELLRAGERLVEISDA